MKAFWQRKCPYTGKLTMRSTTVRDSLTEAIQPGAAGWHAAIDRRRTPRATLRWALYLNGNSTGHPLRAETRNISRDGFYCLLDQPLTPGERIECDIVVPTHDLLDPEDFVYLHCSVQVLRVEKTGTGSGFGIACRIEDYSVVPAHRARD